MRDPVRLGLPDLPGPGPPSLAIKETEDSHAL
jgi:hypothetical protein